jgi:hypothetical protein
MLVPQVGFLPLEEDYLRKSAFIGLVGNQKLNFACVSICPTFLSTIFRTLFSFQLLLRRLRERTQLPGTSTSRRYRFGDLSIECEMRSAMCLKEMTALLRVIFILRFILRGHFLNLWEVIYWPFFEKFFNQRSSEPHVEIYVRKGLQIGIDRIRINKPGFCHRHHGTWLMLQSCTRSALALLAAAYCPEATVLLPNDWKEAVFDTIELLRYWQDEVADAADRLQILEELISVIS